MKAVRLCAPGAQRCANLVVVLAQLGRRADLRGPLAVERNGRAHRFPGAAPRMEAFDLDLQVARLRVLQGFAGVVHGRVRHIALQQAATPGLARAGGESSEERRGGKEWFSHVSSWWAP